MLAVSKTWGLSANVWLQKWTLAGAVLISALTIMASPSFLYSSEEQTEENSIVVPPGAYETHLPKEIYEICLKQHLIETDDSPYISELQNADGRHRLIIQFNDEEEQYITISYRSEKVLNNMRYIQVAYREGALLGYAFFDEQGRDYVFKHPFADEQVTDIANFLLDKIFPVFKE